MYFKLLGTAAGGGFPQWNCACRNCRGVRIGSMRARRRTQSQAAVSGDGECWFLLNASPDLLLQIERTPQLQPRFSGSRNTPLSGIVLTCADLDHVLGLLLLREFQPVRIYCTPGVRAALAVNSFFSVLDRVPNQSRWIDITPGQSFTLMSVASTGLTCTPIALSGSYPQYVRGGQDLPDRDAIIGLLLESVDGVRVAYLPALPAVSEEVLQIFDGCDAVFVDGTFWSEDELQQLVPGARGAREIGHLPVGGAGGSLEILAGLRCARKIYTHINNTNPILDEDSPEHAAVQAAGWEIGFDGWQATLQPQLASTWQGSANTTVS